MIYDYSLSQAREWDEVVKRFPAYDVYYLSGYVKGFASIGDGDPHLLYYEGDSLHAIYVYMKRATGLEGVFDAITPYGYGGVLFDRTDAPQEAYRQFAAEYRAEMLRLGIVDNFVRYNPLSRNAVPMKAVAPVTDLGRTIAMDLQSPEVIWENIISKNRNMIRKAQKNGVEIVHGRGMDWLETFIPIYNETMRRDDAASYYYFDRSLYTSLAQDLPDNYEVFHAIREGQVIASSIMLFAGGRMHYHLSGSLVEYRSLAPSNLLLYEAALWGCGEGFSWFHLGGGLGSHEDALYKFKAAFNRNSDFQFSIGREIFDQVCYDELVARRAAGDPAFDRSSSFFPLYRSGL